jgi:hypothetical protein
MRRAARALDGWNKKSKASTPTAEHGLELLSAVDEAVALSIRATETG